MNTETAVDWLVERINHSRLNEELTLERLYELKKIAKELEKRQVKKDNKDCNLNKNPKPILLVSILESTVELNESIALKLEKRLSSDYHVVVYTRNKRKDENADEIEFKILK